MPTIFANCGDTRFHVSAYEGERSFNLSDYTGDHTLKSAKWRKLPPELKAAIKAALVDADAQLAKETAARDQSRAAIAEEWREDMIRYESDGEPWYLIEKTLAGTNYCAAKDCAETPFYQAHQFGKTLNGHAYDTRLSCYYGRLVDGGIVVDISGALDKSPGLSFASPMLDSHAVEVNRFADAVDGRDTGLLDVLADPSCFGGLATLAKAATVNRSLQAFDKVPLSEWLAWWLDRGARIGRRDGDRILWDDGAIEEIRPETQRWQAND